MSPMNTDPSKLSISDTLLFFDLAGTLMPRLGLPSESQQQTLLRAGKLARRITLVTGQSSDDPQVEFVGRLLNTPETDFIAYTTRGGRRSLFTNDRFVCDDSYSQQWQLGEGESLDLIRVVTEVAESKTIPINEEPKLVDDCAIRTSVLPADKDRLAEAFSTVLPDYSVVAEGRGSVFVMLPGIAKDVAVKHEMGLLKGTPAYYFGDEVDKGNDSVVLSVPDLTVFEIGRHEKTSSPRHARIGPEIADLYAFIDSAIDRG